MEQDRLAPWAEIVPDAPYPMTAAELARLPDDGWLYELVEGRLVRMPPPGGEHGDIASDLNMALRAFVKAHQLGRVFAAETGFLLTQPGAQKELELGADTAFVKTDRLPPRHSEAYRAIWHVAPDLVAEVASPGQHRPAMAVKAQQWLAGGVRLVWVVWPRKQEVDVWLPGKQAPSQTFKMGDSLVGRDVVPGFSYPLAELFA